MSATLTLRRATHPATFRPSAYDDKWDRLIQDSPVPPPPLVLSGFAYVADATASRAGAGRPATVRPRVLALFADSDTVWTVPAICAKTKIKRQSIVNVLNAAVAEGVLVCIENNVGKRKPNKYQRKGVTP